MGITYDVIETYPLGNKPDKKVGVITFEDAADKREFFSFFVHNRFRLRTEKDGTIVINTAADGSGVDCAKYRPQEETK